MKWLRRFEKNGKEKKKTKNSFCYSGKKINSSEKIISKAVTDAEIIHEEFTLVSNVSQSYCRLKDSISRKDSQLGDVQKDRLI